jgi:choline-sulfatase
VHEIQTYSNCNVELRRDYPSYGAVLRERGVHSAYIGKTDVYDRGECLGFSEMILPHDRKLPGDMNHRRRPLQIRDQSRRRADGYGPDEKAFRHDLRCMDAALHWLGQTARKAEPWSLTVNLTNPHFPQIVTPELWDMYEAAADLPEHGPDCASASHPYARDLRDHFETDFFRPEQVRGLRRGYRGCVTFVDRQLGRLLDALDEHRLSDRTVVIYTADHGDMMGKFGMWWKCSLYEDSVRVPCLAAGPGFAPARRVRTPVDLLDVQASLFRATSATRPASWRGQALQDLPENDEQRAVFAEYHGHGTRSGAYLIRRGRWKAVFAMEAENQLFDLDADPAELDNVAAMNPEVMAELERELRAVCDPERENDRAHAFEERQLHLIAKESASH